MKSMLMRLMMPKGSSGEKRPAYVIELTVLIGKKIATGDILGCGGAD